MSLVRRGLRACRNRRAPDTGSAMVEFCFLGVLLMVPLIYVVLTVFEVQNAAYAVSSATREAGRAFVTTPAGGDAEIRAVQAARLAMGDHGLDLDTGQLSIACMDSPCLTAGSSVSMTIRVDVALPLLPAVFGDAVPAALPVEAEHLTPVDRFQAGA